MLLIPSARRALPFTPALLGGGRQLPASCRPLPGLSPLRATLAPAAGSRSKTSPGEGWRQRIRRGGRRPGCAAVTVHSSRLSHRSRSSCSAVPTLCPAIQTSLSQFCRLAGIICAVPSSTRLSAPGGGRAHKADRVRLWGCASLPRGHGSEEHRRGSRDSAGAPKAIPARPRYGTRRRSQDKQQRTKPRTYALLRSGASTAAVREDGHGTERAHLEPAPGSGRAQKAPGMAAGRRGDEGVGGSSHGTALMQGETPLPFWLPSTFLQLLLSATNQPRGPADALDLSRALKPWLR